MKICYLGHSCFELTSSAGTTIVTDPYRDVGFDMPETHADAVTVSHSHFDHNNVRAVSGNPTVFDREGEYEFGGIKLHAIRSYHDEVKGGKRGGNLIFKYLIDGVQVCHMGDIGEACSSQLVEALLPVDVLFIPVGGNYTIDAVQAKKYVDGIAPSYVIPMHYMTEGLEINIGKPDSFIALFAKERVEKLPNYKTELSREDMTKKQTKIILLERKK